MTHMHPLPYDPGAAKKATNVSINSDLLSKARALGINLSRTLEESLVEKVRQLQQQRWREENRAAVDAYNAHVERDGVFSDGLRRF